MKKIIIRLLLCWYANKNREIHKLDKELEYGYFLFKREEDVDKLIKSLLTAQTLWYFEAKSEEERQLVKGATLMLKFLRDGHLLALQLLESKDDNIKEREWKKWRIKKNY